MSETLDAAGQRTAAAGALGDQLGHAGAAALAGAREHIAEGLLRAAFQTWEDPQMRPRLLGVLQAAVNSEEGADRMREFLVTQLMAQAGKAIGKPDMDLYTAAETLGVPALHINAATAQVWGVVLLRYIVKLEPIASAPADELVQLLAPTIQRYLVA